MADPVELGARFTVAQDDIQPTIAQIIAAMTRGSSAVNSFGQQVSQSSQQATTAWAAATTAAQANLNVIGQVPSSSGQAANALLNMAQAATATGQSSANAATQIGTLNVTINQARQAATSAGGAYVSLGGVLGNLPGPAGQAAQAFGFLHAQVTMQTAGMLAAATAVGTLGSALVGSLGEAVDQARQFERTFADVQVVTQATTEQMVAMQAAAMQVGVTTQYNSQEAAKGLYELGSAGFTTAESIKALIPITTAAMLGNRQLGDTTKDVVAGLRQFGMDADQTTHLVDVMTVAVQGSVVHWNEVGNLFANLRGRMGQLKISLEETVAAEMLMTNAGIPAAAASTAIGTAVDRLSKQTRETATGLKELGLNVFDAKGEFVGLLNIYEQLEAKLPTMTTQQSSHAIAMLGGQRAAGAFQAVLQQQQTVLTANGEEVKKGADLYDYWVQRLKAADGASESAARTIGETLDFRIRNLNGSIGEAHIRLGNQLIPALSALVPVATAAVNAFVNAPPALHAAADAAILAAGGMGMLTASVVAIRVATTAFPVAFGVATGAILSLLGPIALVTAAAVALAIAWEQDWGNIREHTAEGATAVGGYLKDLRDDLEVTANWARVKANQFGQAMSAFGTNARAAADQGPLAGPIGAAAGAVEQAGQESGGAYGQMFWKTVASLTPVGGLVFIDGLKNLIEQHKPEMQAEAAYLFEPNAAQLAQIQAGALDQLAYGAVSKIKEGADLETAAMTALWDQVVAADKQGVDKTGQVTQENLDLVIARAKEIMAKGGAGIGESIANALGDQAQSVGAAVDRLMEAAGGSTTKALGLAIEQGNQLAAAAIDRQVAQERVIAQAIQGLNSDYRAQIQVMAAHGHELDALNQLYADGNITVKAYGLAIRGIVADHNELKKAADGAALSEKQLKAEMTPGQQVFEQQAQSVLRNVTQGLTIDAQAKLADFGKGKTAQEQLKQITEAAGGPGADLSGLYYGTPKGIDDRVAQLAAALQGGAINKLVPAAKEAGKSLTDGVATGITAGQPAVNAAADRSGVEAGKTFSIAMSQGLTGEQAGNLLQKYVDDMAAGINPEEARQRYRAALLAITTPEPADAAAAGAETEEVYGQALAQAFNDDLPGTIETVKAKIRELLGNDPTAEAAAEQFGEDLNNNFKNGLSPEYAGEAVQAYLDELASRIPQAQAPAVTAAEVAGLAIHKAMEGQLTPEKAGALADAFGTALSNQLGDKAPVISGALAAIFDPLGTGAAVTLKAAALGASVISGVAQGFADGLPAAITAIQSGAQSLVDAAKSIIRPGSPSRTMAEEVGLPMVQGIGAGFMSGLGSVQGIVQAGVADLVAGANGELSRGMGSLVADMHAELGREIKAEGAATGEAPYQSLPTNTSPNATAGFSAFTQSWMDKLLASMDPGSYDTSKSGTNITPIGMRSNAKLPKGFNIGGIQTDYTGEDTGDAGDYGPPSVDPYQNPTPGDVLIAGMRGRGQLLSMLGGSSVAGQLLGGMDTGGQGTDAAVAKAVEVIAPAVSASITEAVARLTTPESIARYSTNVPPTAGRPTAGPFGAPMLPSRQVGTATDQYGNTTTTISTSQMPYQTGGNAWVPPSGFSLEEYRRLGGQGAGAQYVTEEGSRTQYNTVPISNANFGRIGIGAPGTPAAQGYGGVPGPSQPVTTYTTNTRLETEAEIIQRLRPTDFWREILRGPSVGMGLGGGAGVGATATPYYDPARGGYTVAPPPPNRPAQGAIDWGDLPPEEILQRAYPNMGAQQRSNLLIPAMTGMPSAEQAAADFQASLDGSTRALRVQTQMQERLAQVSPQVLEDYEAQRQALREASRSTESFQARVDRVDQGIADLSGTFNHFMATTDQVRMTEEEWRASLGGAVGETEGTFAHLNGVAQTTHQRLSDLGDMAQQNASSFSQVGDISVGLGTALDTSSRAANDFRSHTELVNAGLSDTAIAMPGFLHAVTNADGTLNTLATSGSRLMAAQGAYLDQFGQLQSRLVDVTNQAQRTAESEFGVVAASTRASMGGPVSPGMAAALSQLLTQYTAAGVNPMPASLANVAWLQGPGAGINPATGQFQGNGNQAMSPDLMFQLGFGSPSYRQGGAWLPSGQRIYAGANNGGAVAGAVDAQGNPVSYSALLQAGQTVQGQYQGTFGGPAPAQVGGTFNAGSGFAQAPAATAVGIDLVPSGQRLDTSGVGGPSVGAAIATQYASMMSQEAKDLANSVALVSLSWSSIADISKYIAGSISTIPGAFSAITADLNAVSKSSITGSWTIPTIGGPSGPISTGPGSGPSPTNGGTYGAQSQFALQQLIDQLAARGIMGGDTNFQSELTKLRQSDENYIRVVGQTTETLADYQREQEDAQTEVSNLSHVMAQLGGAYGQGIGVAGQLAAAQARLAAATAGAAATATTPAGPQVPGYTQYTQPPGSQGPSYYAPTGTTIANTIATQPGPNNTTVSGVNVTGGSQQGYVMIQGVLVPAGASSNEALAILAAHGIFPELPVNPKVFGQGGIVTGRQLAVVGDSGPELIAPLSQLFPSGPIGGAALSGITPTPQLASAAGTRFTTSGSTLASIGGVRAGSAMPSNLLLTGPPSTTPPVGGVVSSHIGGIGTSEGGVITWNGVPLPGYTLTDDDWIALNGVKLTQQELMILAKLKGINLSPVQVSALTGQPIPATPGVVGTPTVTSTGQPVKNYGPVHLVNSTGTSDFYQQPDGSILQAMHGSPITIDSTGYGYAAHNRPVNISGSLAAQAAVGAAAPAFTLNPKDAVAGTRMIRSDDQWDTYIQPDGSIIQVPHGSVMIVDVGGHITWGPPPPAPVVASTPVPTSTGPFLPTSTPATINASTGPFLPTSTNVTPPSPVAILPPPVFTGRVPGFADGGIAWTPQLAMVAERGPERITPLAHDGFGGGNVTIGDIHIHMTSSGNSDQDVALFARKVREALRRQGLDVRRTSGF